MARKEKELDKNGIFQTRFIEQYSKKYRTQAQMAEVLGVSRPTVTSWLNGTSTPDIRALAKIARLFDVSADYLLGLSDTESPDVTVRAAVAYTGLSEAAVEWLHIGLDDFLCDGVGMSEEMKKENLSTASALIQSRAFTKIIDHLNEVVKEAYLERILTILEEQHSECDSADEDSVFYYAKNEDRAVVEANLIHVLKTKGTYWDESVPDVVKAMADEELATNVVQALLSARDANELHQFHAAKAFTGYIDQLVGESCKKAEAKFGSKHTPIS